MRDFLSVLKKYWGYDSFRPLQLEAINSVNSGKDTLVLMPTGGGKSLTYQVPTMANEGICVVITPLISLMKDQTDALKRKGIQSISIHSGMSARQIDISLDNCIYGDYKFLYVSPERIDSDLFRLRFSRMQISLIAVDEAHCISQWGYDFRPSYLKIARLRELAPDAPILALTASATPAVVDDIIDKLKFSERCVKRMSFSRENLSYLVRQTENKSEHLLRIFNNVPGSGIVYVRTRERAEKIAEYLLKEGIAADYYHGGLGYMMRSVKQDKWIKGTTRVIVATNAFGMGIDKADVRFVVHYDLCDSIESYYQEAGRAGRDGLPAYAVLLLSEQDKQNARKRIDFEFPPIEKIKSIYDAVFNYYQIEIGGGRGLSREFNVFEFCAKTKMFPPMVVNAIKILQLNSLMILTDESDHPPRVMFIVSRDDLYKIRVERDELDYFIKVLLRTYTGLFSDFVAVNLNEISYLSGYTIEKINEHFKRLWQLHIIKYIPGSRSSLIVFSEERLPQSNLRISPESYKIRKEISANRLASMIDYAENNDRCRSLILQNYFGDESVQNCGKCDICRENRNSSKMDNTIKDQILELLRDGEVDFHKTVSLVIGDVNLVLAEIKSLIEAGIIEQNARFLRIKK